MNTFIERRRIKFVLNVVTQIMIGIPLEMHYGRWMIMCVTVLAVVYGMCISCTVYSIQYAGDICICLDMHGILSGSDCISTSLITLNAMHMTHYSVHRPVSFLPVLLVMVFTLSHAVSCAWTVYERMTAHTNISSVPSLTGCVLGAVVGVCLFGVGTQRYRCRRLTAVTIIGVCAGVIILLVLMLCRYVM